MRVSTEGRDALTVEYHVVTQEFLAGQSLQAIAQRRMWSRARVEGIVRSAFTQTLDLLTKEREHSHG